MTRIGSLILGWKLTPDGHPRYWLNSNSKPGSQTDADLATIPANSLDTHSVIIARSGSGKSFFLGRLIEEILLRSRANCVILDPNGDFRQVHIVKDQQFWSHAKYNPLTRSGFLPHESSRNEFVKQWQKIAPAVLTADRKLVKGGDPYRELKLWWPSLRADFFTEDLQDPLRMEVQQCHPFVQAIAPLVILKSAAYQKELLHLGVAENLIKRFRGHREAIDNILRKQFDLDELAKRITPENVGQYSDSLTDLVFDEDGAVDKSVLESSLKWAARVANDCLNYVTPDACRIYFLLARQWVSQGIIAYKDRATFPAQKRLLVLDLPSLREMKNRLLAISALLTVQSNRAYSKWASAMRRPANNDHRVPTFIIVDEAHSLIPAQATGRMELGLRDQFRTIAAEGRKYGLFLILVSQRPDKIDPLTVSECENKALMRMDSQSVLDITRRLLAMDDLPPSTTGKCLQFAVGCALLTGRWAADEPCFLYTAGRRTEEGGRNLRPDYWAAQEE